jgi:hypothetical protein
MRTLKIYYELRDSDDVIREMEENISKAVQKHGYKLAGLGINFIEGMRDICFEKEE